MGIKVLIGSRQIPEVESLLEGAPPGFDFEFLPEGASQSDHLEGVEILFGRLAEAEFPHAQSLKWAQQPHAGVEGFMYKAFKDSDIVLTNCKGGLFGPQISEHVFALLFALTRRIPDQLEFMKKKNWERVPCLELSGLTMGIIGLGGIGRALADRAKAFELRVLAVDPENVSPPPGVDRLGKMDYLPEMASASHVLVVCCPSTPESHKMVNKALFDRMPDESFLINVSRGKVVDEKALVAALRSGKLAGAGLDVTYAEPCPPDSPLWTEPNVILTSHSAGASQHIRRRAMELFVENLHRYAKGEPLRNLVNKEKGY